MYALLLGFQETVELALEREQGTEGRIRKTPGMVWSLGNKVGFPAGDPQFLPAMEMGMAVWVSVEDRH